MAILTQQPTQTLYDTDPQPITFTPASAGALADKFLSGGREFLLVQGTGGEVITVNNPSANCNDSAVHVIPAGGGIIRIGPFPRDWRSDGYIELTASATTAGYAVTSCANESDCIC